MVSGRYVCLCDARDYFIEKMICLKVINITNYSLRGGGNERKYFQHSLLILLITLV